MAEEDLLENIIPDTEISFSHPMDSQIRRLKDSLDDWKQIILSVKHLLLWDKQWHPTAIIGGNTIFFTSLWLVDPSFLSIIATVFLIFTLSEYFLLPILNTIIIKEKWNAQKEKEFEMLCVRLWHYKIKIELLLYSYYTLKKTNTKTYVAVTVTTLLVLIWIGNLINNLCLLFLLTNIILLLPGFMQKEALNKINGILSVPLNEFLSQCKKIRQNKTK